MFFLLAGLTALASALFVPYQFNSPPLGRIPVEPIPLALAALIGGLLGAVGLTLGIPLAGAVGIEARIANAAVYGGDVAFEARRAQLPRAAVIGIAAGILTWLGATVIHPPLLGADGFERAGLGASALATVAAAIAEEEYRFVALGVVAWVLARFRLRRAAIPAAIVVAALLAHVAHPPAARLDPLGNAWTIIAVYFVGGVSGVPLGWVMWRNGLEAAMVAHLAARLAILAGVTLVR